MAEEFVVKGMRELALNLEGFPAKLQRKAMGVALRAAGRVIRDVARARVPVRFGKLKRSIRVTITRDRRNGNLVARVIAGRRARPDDPYYAWMVEGGTKPHIIRGGNTGRSAASINRSIRRGALRIGDAIIAGAVSHPGAKPTPFLEPALAAGAEAALRAMASTLEDEIAKLMAGP